MAKLTGRLAQGLCDFRRALCERASGIARIARGRSAPGMGESRRPAAHRARRRGGVAVDCELDARTLDRSSSIGRELELLASA
jgi:hypothetical protein